MTEAHCTVLSQMLRNLRSEAPAAQLLWGPCGNAALALACRAIEATMCQKILHVHTKGCGICSGCRQTLEAIHPDVSFLFPSGSSARSSDRTDHGLKEWRQFISKGWYQSFEDWCSHLRTSSQQLVISVSAVRKLLSHTYLKATRGTCKSVLIWLPERLHPNAAHALLKTLEEPPARTSFLLVSHRLDKIPPTIRSRAQQRYVPAFSDQEITQILGKRGVLEPKNQEIARLASGNLSQALKIPQADHQDHAESFRTWLRSCYRAKFVDLLSQADRFHSLDRALQKAFLVHGLYVLRESVVTRAGCTHLLRVVEKEREFAENFSKSLDFKRVVQLKQYLEEAYSHLEKYVNAKMIYTTLSLRTVSTMRAQRLRTS